MCTVNGPLLADLGLAEAPVDVPGGLVVVDDDGRPTGLLQEQAQQLLNALVLPYPVSQLVDAIERAGRVYLSQGLTSVVEAGGSARARSRSRPTRPPGTPTASRCAWS
jgi:predicted amidohydrolase YtcJ